MMFGDAPLDVEEKRRLALPLLLPPPLLPLPVIRVPPNIVVVILGVVVSIEVTYAALARPRVDDNTIIASKQAARGGGY